MGGQAVERAELLRKTWGIDIQYSNAESTYPMDILERGQQIGRIICSYGCKFLVIELSGIGKLNRDKELPGGDALEVWDFQNPPCDLTGPAADIRIGGLIYQFVSLWAEQHGQRH